jgi:uncharacterized protein (DUF2336 family)
MSASKLDALIDLAKEPSSARRRELLREVTDMFFSTGAQHGAVEMELFDGVLGPLAKEMEEEVRAELAERFADASQAPPRLIHKLAGDSITVAAPLLARSKTLSDEALLQFAQTQDQEHLRAISARPGLSARISDAIVDRGDDETLGALLENQTAVLSRHAQEAVVDRAAGNPDLHAAVVNRRCLPPDLLNEMYFMVEGRLRETIMARNAELDPQVLEEALAKGRRKLAERDGALPPDYAEAEAHVKRLMKGGKTIGPATLAGFLRQGEKTRFQIALAEMADIDFATARRIVERRELDALAIICKAANLDRSMFVTFVVLILPDNEGMRQAGVYGVKYNELSLDAALRTIRFWRMRRQSGDIAAA